MHIDIVRAKEKHKAKQYMHIIVEIGGTNDG